MPSPAVASAPAPAATSASVAPPPVDEARLARVPVTRFAPEPAAAPTPPAARPLRVQPDPLTPRIVGSGTLPTSQVRRPPPPVSRHDRGPTVPELPIAGYEKRSPQSDAGPTIAFASAASGVQQRDLEAVATPGPTYPPYAFRQGIEGWVEVEYTVTERGATTDVAVVAAAPRGVFDDAAISAVGNWKYRPRIVNGQPVAQRTSVTLHFNVED
jgi:protein TonB